METENKTQEAAEPKLIGHIHVNLYEDKFTVEIKNVRTDRLMDIATSLMGKAVELAQQDFQQQQQPQQQEQMQ